MKWWQIVLLGIFIVALISGAGYLGLRFGMPKQEVAAESSPVTVEVTRGDVNQTISAPGELLWTETINLYIDASGQISDILVRSGDWVEAGDVLVRLDDTDAQVLLAQTEIDLRQAALQLQDLAEGADPADLSAAQAKLAAAQAELTLLTDPSTDQEVLSAQQNLASAQEGLNTSLAGGPQEELIRVKADLESARAAVQQAQSAFDEVKWRSDISALPQSAVLQTATIAYERAQANYDLVAGGATEEELAGARAKVATARTQLETLLDDPDPDAVDAAEAWVEQAQAELDDLVAGASAKDLEVAELNVARALLIFNTAREEAQKTTLMAPIDGVILDVNVSQGQTVTKGASGGRMAEPSALELYATVIEEDYTIIEVGQPVEVFFDAMPERTVSGRIARIVPEKIRGERPLYPVYMELDKIPASLAEGMTADTEIIIDTRQDVLRLPRSLVKARSDGSAEVSLWQDSQEVQRSIQTGLRGDTYAEIVDGLAEGDQVVGR